MSKSLSKKKPKVQFKQIDDLDQNNELQNTDRNVLSESPIQDQQRIHVKCNSDLEIFPIHIKSTEQNEDGELTAKSDDSQCIPMPKRRADHFRDNSTSNLIIKDGNELPEILLVGSMQQRQNSSRVNRNILNLDPS